MTSSAGAIGREPIGEQGPVVWAGGDQEQSARPVTPLSGALFLAGVLGRIVPFLVAAGSLALLLQPRIAARSALRAGDGRGSVLLLPSGLLVLSVYNGYFGAGSGVLFLALLMLTTEPALVGANALKNMVVGAATITSAVLFIVLAHVDWAAVGRMFAGSLAGPWVARRMPPALLRWLVALTGLALAVRLWLSPAA